jgi:hypothetical protein
MDTRQGGELAVPQGHIVIQVGRDDAEQVVGVAEQPLGVADLRYRDERGFESALAVLLARRRTGFPRRPSVLAFAWAALLTTAAGCSAARAWARP